MVVYSAQDREFAEPILRAYEKRTGVEVLPKFDVESTKTVGLANDIIAEKSRPRCDLFWNNEILNTLRLKEQGLLAPFQPSHAGDLPETFKAKDGTWYGFAGRARVLIVNTKLIPEAERPKGIKDLLDPKWKGKIGIAKPLFGTTATHAACLFAAWGDEKAKGFFRDLKANGVQVLSGNKQVATATGSGQIAFGLTDTDDAMGEVEAGSPVAIVYPDRKPTNSVRCSSPTPWRHQGGPHPGGGASLADHLLSPEVEAALANGPRRRSRCLKTHRGLGTRRDAEDRPRDGGRLRGRGEGLEQGRRISRRRVRRLIPDAIADRNTWTRRGRAMKTTKNHAQPARFVRPAGSRPASDRRRIVRARARRRPGTSRQTRPAGSPGDSPTRSGSGKSPWTAATTSSTRKPGTMTTRSMSPWLRVRATGTST